MNIKSHKFSTEELEILSKAYLECRLSKVQEKELELVLLSYDISSPLIDEARQTMGITTMLESLAAKNAIKSRHRFGWLKWAGAAACIAIAIGIGIRQGQITPSIHDNMNSKYFTVYIDGQLLSPELAQKTAVETQMACMALLEKTVRDAQSAQNESTRIINQK